jgi:hypothetical protein
MREQRAAPFLGAALRTLQLPAAITRERKISLTNRGAMSMALTQVKHASITDLYRCGMDEDAAGKLINGGLGLARNRSISIQSTSS